MRNEFFYPSKDGATQIRAIEWKPETEVKAILQLCHGMTEHIERYHDFAEFLAGHGYYVVGNDHLGHGKSITGPEKLGYFHETNGNAYVIADIHQLRVRTEKKYPNIPYFIMGHSMGSFLVRQYLGMYGSGLTGAIVMGTGDQPSLILEAGKLVCKVIAMFRGWEYRSKLVHGMAAGGYDKAFKNETDGSNWLSRNPENVKKYKDDPLSGFMFTVNAYYHMFSGMAKMNKQESEGKLPMALPVLFVAGAEDPVGNYGKSVVAVYQRYQALGMQDVEMKLYEEDRHEILNEADRDVVFRDILAWLENRN
ncbi:MAG: lysophospholipase [Tyzzerella sp.]|nr:lysophospholipase [Tyzzerella sp.]